MIHIRRLISLLLLRFMSNVPIRTFKKLVRRSCSVWSRSKSDEPHPVRQDVPVSSNHFVRKRMINEWSMRGVCEFERSEVAFFFTLTYDDDHLPRMHDGRLAFCPTHIDFFLNSIRSKLENDGIGKSSFKYFITSEKGSKNGRPHYHGTAYFSRFLNPKVPTYDSSLGPVRSQFLPKVRKFSTDPVTQIIHKSLPVYSYFHDLVKTFWPFGFSDVQVPRNGTAVVKYISGYVCKDMFSLDIDTSKMSPEVREIHTLYRPYKTIPKNCPRDFLPGKTYNAIFTTYNFHRQSLHFGDNILDSITPMNWLSGCMTKVIDGKVYTFALPKYARDKMLRTLEYSKDETGKRVCRSKITPLGIQVRENMTRNKVDEVFRWLESLKIDENLCYVRDTLGIDFDYDSTKLSLYYNTNECHHTLDMKEDLYDYLLNKRGWRMLSYGNKFVHLGFKDNISGIWTSPMGDILQVLPVVDPEGNLKPPLWNSWYQGYERLLKIYEDVQFSFDCAKQRKDEYDEFVKKRDKFLRHGK